MRTKELAQRLEVSAKTIHRDFEFLRDRLHLDVELDRSGGEFRWKARDAAEVLPLVTTLNRLTPCLNESI